MRRTGYRGDVELVDERNPAHFHRQSAQLFEGGELNGALMAALKAVELTFSQSPPNPWFTRHLMRVLVDNSQPRIALAIYKQAIEQKVDRYLLSLQKARALRLLKQEKDARACLKWALSNVSDASSVEDKKQIEEYLKLLS